MTGLTLIIDQLPDSTIVRVCGEVDATNHAQLAAAIDEGRHLGAPVILDLSAMTFLDSSGMHTLLLAYNQATIEGQELHLAALHPRPRRTLEIVGLLAHLQPHTTVEQALKAANGHRPESPAEQ